MKSIIYFAVVILIICPIFCNSDKNRPAKLIVNYETGPLPPPYFYEETTEIQFNHENKTISVKYDRDYKYRDTLPEEELTNTDKNLNWSGVLDKSWYDDFLNITESIETTETPSELIGGGHTKITITFNIEDKKEGYLIKNPDFTKLQDELILAIRQSAGIYIANTFKMANVKEDKSTEVVSCELDYISRTVKASLFIDNKLINTKDLNKTDFRELRKLISAPNYYDEGETEILPDISGYYFDRGNETWYSYKNGIKDPSNKSGIKQSLLNYFENLREQLMKK